MSINKVSKADGSKAWRARYRDPAGASREKWFDRKIDAERHIATVTVSVMTGNYIDPSAGKVKVAGYAREWAAAQPWRPNTRNTQVSILEHHIIPAFGTRELRSIRRSEVQAWVGTMVTGGLAPSTVGAYLRVLSSVMRAATLDKLIADSPCRGVKLPRREVTTSALTPLSTSEVHQLAATVAPRYAALVLASAGLGLRQGEACGLTVDRIDFLRRKVTIDRQMLSVAGVPAAHGPVKTPASIRSLVLADSVGRVLSVHIRKYPPGPSGLMFTTESGQPMNRSRWASEFKRATDALEIDATPHDLRHHAASMLIAAGCSVKAVQHFLGHATAAETLNTYAHLWPDDEDRIRVAIDAAWTAPLRSVG